MSSLIVKLVSPKKWEKHTNADRLALVFVEGWICVTGLENIEERMQKMIYIPVDSVLDEKLGSYLFPEGSKIRLPKHNRIVTEKIRGALSQGMVIDVDDELLSMYPKLGECSIGDDVKDTLGISKYEPPAPAYWLGLQACKVHEGFDKYTNIENIKNFPAMFELGENVYVTLKLHGTSARFGWFPKYEKTFWNKCLQFLGFRPKFEFIAGSRNQELSPTQCNLYNTVAKEYNLANKLKPGEVLYGEIVGEGIQAKYNYGFKGGKKGFFAYDLKVNGSYLYSLAFLSQMDEREIPRVPGARFENTKNDITNGYRSCFMPYDPIVVEDLLKEKWNLNDSNVREGIVIKSYKEYHDPYLGRKVLKAINPAYLLKEQTEYQ